MRTRISGALAILAALAACKSDPTADGVGTPDRVILDFATLTLTQGDSASVTAQVVDTRLTPLEQPISFASCDGAAATVAIDATFQPVPATRVRARIHAVGPGAPCIIASSAGAKPDSVTVTVLPTVFNGTLSASTLAGGASLTIRGTSQLKFDTAQVSVDFAGGFTAPFLLKRADSVIVAVPFSDPGPLTISGVSLAYKSGTVVTLPTTASFTQAGDFWGPGDSSFATAPVLPLPAAAGQSTGFTTDLGPANNTHCAEVVLGFGSTGPCMIFQFTVAAPTSLTFSTNWQPGGAVSPDIDIYACPAPQAAAADLNNCFEEGGGGATGSKPQAFTFTFPAGTHYLVIEDFDNTSATRNFSTTIKRN